MFTFLMQTVMKSKVITYYSEYGYFKVKYQFTFRLVMAKKRERGGGGERERELDSYQDV